MNLIEIIEEGLKENGYSGLYNDNNCGCTLVDLSPGGCLCDDCRPGHVSVHSLTKEWIVSKYPNVKDEDMQYVIDNQ